MMTDFGGLLDFVKTPEGQGLLSAAFGGLAGARRGQPLNSLGRAGLAGLQGYGGALERQAQEAQYKQAGEMRTMQMDKLRKDQEQQAQQKAWFETMDPGTLAMSNGQGPTLANASAIDPTRQNMFNAAKVGALPMTDYLNLLKPKDPKYQVVGDSLVRTDTPTPTAAYTAQPKPEAAPSSVREFQYGQANPAFSAWLTGQKKAGATSITVPTDNLGLKPKDRFDMEDKLRGDYTKATGNDSEIVSNSADIKNILAQNGPLKDQAAIYKFAKSLDPAGAVREADYAAIVKTAGGLDYVTSLFNKALTGEQLSPKQRLEMGSLMESMAGVAQKRIAKNQDAFGKRAKMYNLAPENVFTPADSVNSGWGIVK